MIGILAVVAAAAAMIAYGIRAGVQMVDDTWPDRAMRAALVALLLAILVAFVDVAAAQNSLIWRQWPVFVCLLLVAVTAGWPRR